jgi:glutaredoxin
VASTRSPRVVVFHAPGCHLCEQALAQLDALQKDLSFDLELVDISGDESLEATYREWLPVVEIDGRRRFTYYLQEGPFRAAVAQAAAQA